MTAKAIEDAQSSKYPDGGNVSVVQVTDLREQDFGSFECLPWSSKRPLSNADRFPKPDDAGFKPKETSEAMANRAKVFLDDYLLSQLPVDEEQEAVVAVVSHGLLLAVLWKSIIARFGAHTISLGPEISGKTGSRPLEYLPGWSNTGYIELEITPISVPEQVSTYSAEDCPTSAGNKPSEKLDGWNLLVRTVNSKQHLSNLKRTRGGLGSSVYDARQKNLEGYFKKPKVTRDDCTAVEQTTMWETGPWDVSWAEPPVRTGFLERKGGD